MSKRTLPNLLVVVALVLALVASVGAASTYMAQAATTVIAQWTFESPYTPTAATAATYPKCHRSGNRRAAIQAAFTERQHGMVDAGR